LKTFLLFDSLRRENIKIKLEKIKEDWYRADFIELTGSPSCGDGKTPEMAIASLFVRHLNTPTTLMGLLHSSADGGFSEGGYLEINGKHYEYPYPVDR